MEIDRVEALQAELHLLRQENLRLRSMLPEHDPPAPDAKRFDEQFQPLAESLGEGLLLTDLDDVIVYVSPRMIELTGYRMEELIGRPAYECLLPPSRWSSLLKRNQDRSQGQSERYELELICKDGSTFIGETRAAPWRDAHGNVIGTIGAITDVTERRRLHEQLILSQKIESIARLAGGIAHDFNNLLTAILGYTGLAQTETQPGSDMDGFHRNIQKAAERAAELTHQLLAFAHRTTFEPTHLNPGVHIAQMHETLRRRLRDDIELVLVPAENGKEVYTDPMLFEQMLGKLVENSRDALPAGGRIVIETGNVVVSEEEARSSGDLEPGEYVQIVVADNGTGMSPEVKSRIFDPFFTTKPQGQGAGLGLAMCYGMVTQSAGTIRVESTEGVGTRFSIWLPMARQSAEESAVPSAPQKTKMPEPHTAAYKTILLVEDDPMVRSITARGLRDHGYHVLEASQGREALQVADGYADAIDLVITDVIMPQMGGKELAAHLQKRRPETQVLFISGYSDNAIVRRGVLEKGLSFLQKPFTAEALAQSVQETLKRNGKTPD